MIMQNSLKAGLLIAGIALLSFGLYNVFSPDTIIDAGPIQVKAKDNSLEAESIVFISLGVVALLASLFYKKNKSLKE